MFGASSFYIVVPVYFITIIFAFTPAAESFWRIVQGVRPLRLRGEKNRLRPIFREVSTAAIKTNEGFRWRIGLYIKEDMSVNAFSLGRGTLILTRGSLVLLNDEELKGLIAHELGHFAHYDPIVSLVTSVGNFFLSLSIILLEKLKAKANPKKGLFALGYNMLLDFLLGILRFIRFLGDIFIMHLSRKKGICRR